MVSMSISFLVAAGGTLAALVGTVLLIRRCAQAPRADLVAWVLALAGMVIGLAAQAVGYHRGFAPTTFRAAQLGLALIAPLALAWGMAEMAARGLVMRFAARLCLCGLFVVAAVILATDVLSDQAFSQAWPLARMHYQLLPLSLLAVVAVAVVLTLICSLAAAGLRARQEPGWRPVLLVLGAAAVAALATQGLLVNLPVNAGYAALSLLAAVAAGLAGDRAARVRLAALRGGPGGGGSGGGPAPAGRGVAGPDYRSGSARATPGTTRWTCTGTATGTATPARTRPTRATGTVTTRPGSPRRASTRRSSRRRVIPRVRPRVTPAGSPRRMTRAASPPRASTRTPNR